MSTVYILWLKQVKKYVRSRSRIIGSLGQPILFLVAFGFGLGSLFQRAGEGDYMQFLAPGIILMSVLFTSIFSGVELIWDRQFGFLEETMVALVSRLEIMLGRTLGSATVAALQGTIVFVITLFVGFRPQELAMLPLAALFAVLVAVLFTALGTVIGSMLDDMQGFQLIMNFLVMPIFFLSGALFPLQGAPPLMEFIARIDRMSYGIDGLRGALVSLSTFGMTTDLLVLGALAALLLAAGSYLFESIQI